MTTVSPRVPIEQLEAADAAVLRPLGWLDRLRARRAALMADPVFQRWAARFPLTRPFARKRARDVFDIVSGFVYTQTLLACQRLRLLDALADGPLPAATLARRVGVSEEGFARLLEAAAALHIVERRDGWVFIGEIGAILRGRPELQALVEHDALLYEDMADPVALLRNPRGETTRLAAYFPYAVASEPAALTAERVARYSELMAASQPLVAAEILDAYDVSRHARMMDVGGGEGAFAIAAAGRAPGLRLTVFDLPAVVARAEARLAAAGLAARAEVVGGDFHRDALPAGADLVTLVRVLHDHDDEPVRALLARVHAILPPGGVCLIGEPLAGAPGAETVGHAYFAWYLHAMGRGRARTADEYAALLRDAGFHSVRHPSSRAPHQVGVVIGVR